LDIFSQAEVDYQPDLFLYLSAAYEFVKTNGRQ